MKSRIKAELMQECDLRLDYSDDGKIKETIKRIATRIKRLEKRQK